MDYYGMTTLSHSNGSGNMYISHRNLYGAGDRFFDCHWQLPRGEELAKRISELLK